MLLPVSQCKNDAHWGGCLVILKQWPCTESEAWQGCVLSSVAIVNAPPIVEQSLQVCYCLEVVDILPPFWFAAVDSGPID